MATFRSPAVITAGLFLSLGVVFAVPANAAPNDKALEKSKHFATTTTVEVKDATTTTVVVKADDKSKADENSKSDDKSKADGRGANVSGAYDSNSTGAASENGNGKGKATGRPEAGSVGKADDKNPPGQKPDGSDKNKGYECDDNKGIGKGNPAHTGCEYKPAETTTTTEAPTTTTTEAPAAAPVTSTTAPAEVLDETVTAPAPAEAALVEGENLAFTGSDSTTMAMGAGALVAFGVAILLIGALVRRPLGQHFS